MLSPGFELFLIGAGARTTAKDNYHLYSVFGEGHQLKVSPLPGQLGQVTGYPGQIYKGITGATIFQGYLNLPTTP